MEWAQAGDAYTVYLSYGSNKEETRDAIFGEEFKTYSSFEEMRKAIEVLHQFCTKTGYTLWQSTVYSVPKPVPK